VDDHHGGEYQVVGKPPTFPEFYGVGDLVFETRGVHRDKSTADGGFRRGATDLNAQNLRPRPNLLGDRNAGGETQGPSTSLGMTGLWEEAASRLPSLKTEAYVGCVRGTPLLRKERARIDWIRAKARTTRVVLV